jgi:hypothetical protein
VVLNACCFVGAEKGAGRTRDDYENFESYRTALLVCEIISEKAMGSPVFGEFKSMTTN